MEEAFRIVDRGLCLRGTVSRGTIRPGVRLTFEHHGTKVTGKVVTIAVERRVVEEAGVGPDVGLLLRELTDTELERSLHPTPEQMERPEPPLASPLPQVVREAD